jgi:hypothetical protein
MRASALPGRISVFKIHLALYKLNIFMQEKNYVVSWIQDHKVLTPIIFWGAFIILLIGLSGLRDTEPNLSDDYQVDYYEGGGVGHPLWNN